MLKTWLGLLGVRKQIRNTNFTRIKKHSKKPKMSLTEIDSLNKGMEETDNH